MRCKSVRAGKGAYHMRRNYYRGLRIVHNRFNFEPGDSYETKCQKIRARVQDLKDKGYGGIVTNVLFGKDYLKDPVEFQLMREKAQACKDLNMRMWLYDEDRYPSGAAGTRTLEANPDYEARGLVMVWHVLAPGARLTQTLPHGHEKLIAAVSYQIAGDTPADEELLSPFARYQGDPIEFDNHTDKNLLCLAFYSKRMYEGTHAQNNVAYHRRYVDVSNPEAIAEFINNTYRPYTEAVGEFYSPSFADEGENSVIEAIFTDEPSYMGVYINDKLEAQPLHPVDESIPLYTVVNWGKNVANRFATTYGYRLEDELTALFLGHGERFCRIRHDYYQLMSDLYEQAFYAQLSDYCAQVGLNFSGHILLEDQLAYHVMFEGNFFSLLRHMHIPGIDMLTSKPQNIWDMAFTPKLARSISELYGHEHVMDEVSGFLQAATATNIGNITLEEMYNALMQQLAFGVDIFTSYYADEDPDGSKKKIWDAVARATEAITGKRVSDTLLFYPIETMMRRRKPLYHSIEDCHEPLLREQDDNGWACMQACENAMLGAQFAMLNAQHNFTYVDANTAHHQPDGVWKNMVIGACDVTDELQMALKHLAEGGTQVIWYVPAGCELMDSDFAKLPEGAKRAATPEELLAILCPDGTLLTGDHEGIAMAESTGCILLVNKDDMDKKVCWHGEFASLTDAYDGAEVAAEKCDDCVCFSIGGFSAYILKK